MYERYGLTLITPPVEEPLSADEAKRHCRVDVSEDDSYIEGLIAAARERCEVETDRSFVTQTWRMTIDEFQPEMLLPRGPHRSVDLVEYYDQTNTLRTLAATTYEADLTADPARIRLGYGQFWPLTYGQLWSLTRWGKPGAVRVTFTAGYGTAAAVPAGIKHAVKMLVAHWYENREIVMSGRDVILPMMVDDLLDHYRNGVYR